MIGLPMRDDDLRTALSKIYSKFYCKWRSKGSRITEADFDLIVKEMNFIASQYPQYPFVKDLLVVFLHELEARAAGGYKDMMLVRWNINDGFEITKELKT